MDLHGKNLVLALVDETRPPDAQAETAAFLGQILAAMEISPVQDRRNRGGIDLQLALAEGRAMDAGYGVKLVNTAAVSKCEGLKPRRATRTRRGWPGCGGLLPTG